MKITRAIREEAALICAISASNEWLGCAAEPDGGRPDSRETSPAHELAWAAHDVALDVWSRLPWERGWPEAHWAEAEAMLRTGWRPRG